MFDMYLVIIQNDYFWPFTLKVSAVYSLDAAFLPVAFFHLCMPFYNNANSGYGIISLPAE